MAEGKTALVLSAGGMFGAYQAGVWQSLSEIFNPDLVVGASVGSLNGWMIASGCPPGEIADRWLSLEQARQIRWRIPARLSDGFLDAVVLEGWIQEMCSRWSPNRELGIVATDLRTMRPRLFQHAELTWEHVAASCAVPLVLKHSRIGGVYYSDGGLVDPLPLWAALEMGARTIVTINLMKHRPWLVRQAVRGLQAYSGYGGCRSDGIRVIDISPDGPLGSVRESIYWSRANAARWIRRGRQDADAAGAAVVECLTAASSCNWGTEK